MLVEQSLGYLKSRLADKNFFEIYQGEGRIIKVTCTFNEPAPVERIEEFELKTNLSLPPDYKRFLQTHNGVTLFDDVEYGGECYLYDIDYVFENYLDWQEDFPSGWISIGYHYGDEILIDCDKFQNGNKYCLLYRDACEPSGVAHLLNLSFELWLDRLIICQGLNFWNPPRFAVEDNY
ncbi:SMI1/KNR4 family protein [Peribacillus sp. SCS-155]|uniref:SMI1/KNR4 family protein n=1 Tax=Peribacillus sedimenti TaxID=3115297 RepID=UPI003905FD55